MLDGLKYGAALLLAPFTKFSMRSFLLTNLFKKRQRDYEAEIQNYSNNEFSKKKLAMHESEYVRNSYFCEAIRKDVGTRKSIEPKTLLQTIKLIICFKLKASDH